MKTEIEQIKSIPIAQVAKDLGFDIKGNKAINNPLRNERHVSVAFYPETNSYMDFGGDGGSVIDLYKNALGKTTAEAIKALKEDYNIEDVKDYEIVTVPNKTYMKPASVLKAFNSPFHQDMTFANHKDTLIDISPEWLLKGADDKDKIEYFNLLKYSPNEKTALVLLPDEHGISHTFRYRYKDILDVKKKWVALSGTKASYPYCRLTEDKITLIVEGSRDYLNALLCGFSVIAIPQAGFKLDNELIKDRMCVFIDDDDSKDYMRPLYDNASCEKVLFDHKKFKELTKCTSKDFTDYLYCYNDKETFKKEFLAFIDTLEHKEDDWHDTLFKVAQPITLEDIENAQNQVFLYPNLIIENNITMIVAPPNSGKSALTYGIIQDLFDTGSIENCFFLDPDSTLSYVKDTVEKLTINYGDKFSYYNGVKHSLDDMHNMLNAMVAVKQGVGNKTLVVCDGLQFFSKGTINDDTSSKDFLQLLKTVRDRFGATVIVLHHTLKAKDEKGNTNYIGSQIIETITDNMLILKSENKNELEVFVKKSRSDKKGLNFKVDIDFAERRIHSVVEIDPIEIDMQEVLPKTEIAQKIYEYLANRDNKPFIGNIIKLLPNVSKSKINEVMDEYIGIKWKVFEAKFGNRYEVIVGSSPEVTEYVMSDDLVEIPDFF